MAEFSATQRSDGYWECSFLNFQGNVQTITGATPEIAIAKVEKYIAAHGGGPLSSMKTSSKVRKAYGRRGANVSGRQWGRPTKAQSNYKYQLTQIFGEITAKAIMATTAIGSAVNAKVTGSMAQTIMDRVYEQRGRYNVYTGNLDRAYMAHVVQGRKATAVVYPRRATTNGNPVIGQNGKRIVYVFKRNHGLGIVRQNSYRRWNKRRRGLLDTDRYQRVSYRYFKRWERQDGYRNKSYIGGFGGQLGGFGRMAGDKLNRIQSGIVIENAAPYSAAVNKHYRVPPYGAMARSYSNRYGSQQKQLVTVISKRMLQAAKLL